MTFETLSVYVQCGPNFVPVALRPLCYFFPSAGLSSHLDLFVLHQNDLTPEFIKTRLDFDWKYEKNEFTTFSQLEMTLFVAECLLPDYMDGLSHLYNSSHIHKYHDNSQKQVSW